MATALRYFRSILAALGILIGVIGAAPSFAGTLKVGSQNLLHDFPNYYMIAGRLGIVEERIKKLQLDVVGVQEASQNPGFQGLNTLDYLGSKLSYQSVYKSMEKPFKFLTGFENGLGVLSRFPISSSEIRYFDAQLALPFSILTGRESRAVIRAVIETPDGPVNFYTAHLSGNPEINFLQIKELAEFVLTRENRNPSIVTGDFNTEPDSASIEYLKGKYSFIDTQSVNPKSKPTCCVCIEKDYFNSDDPCPSFDASAMKSTIDYIFIVPGRGFSATTKSFDLLFTEPNRTVDTQPLWPSDHLGVTAEIEIQESDNRVFDALMKAWSETLRATQEMLTPAAIRK